MQMIKTRLLRNPYDDEISNDEFMSKQVSELNVADIVKIVTSANKGILSRLDTLRDDIHGKVNDFETRVQLLENDNEKKDQEISKLKLKSEPNGW